MKIKVIGNSITDMLKKFKLDQRSSLQKILKLKIFKNKSSFYELYSSKACSLRGLKFLNLPGLIHIWTDKTFQINQIKRKKLAVFYEKGRLNFS